MIEYDQFCVIHMPRAGGSFIRHSIPNGRHHSPGHDGWSTFFPFTKDVYGLIRDPRSWYLSLHAYCIKHNLLWKDLFGIDSADTLQVSLSRWISGSHAQEIVVDASGLMSPANVIAQMREFGIGFWSWWVLHLYGACEVSVDNRLADGLRFLWLHNRVHDLDALHLKYQCPVNPQSHSRNRSVHPSVSRAFDDELNDLVDRKDGQMLAIAMTHPSGVQ